MFSSRRHNFDDVWQTLYYITLLPKAQMPLRPLKLSTAVKSRSNLVSYILVLKPRETALILFIGACSAIIAASTLPGVFPAGNFVLILIALTLGSAGANGLTNYLDRNADAKMTRTCRRVLPARKIDPPEKALYLTLALIAASLVLAWLLSPVCFYIGLVGFVCSALWRKTISCTLFGIVAGSAPVLIGWYAMTKQPVIDVMPVVLFLLIALWTPVHVWTLMMANREDYEKAGLRYFPLNMTDTAIVRILAVLSVALSLVAMSAYLFTRRLGWLYLVISGVLSLIMICANLRLLFAPTSANAWTVYKLSAFPYLGIIFTVMAVDSWLM
jgi:heme o synthase